MSVAKCALAKNNPFNSNASHSTHVSENGELKTARYSLMDLKKARTHMVLLIRGIQCCVPGICCRSYTNNHRFFRC